MCEAVGPGYPITFRIAGNEFVSGGNDSRQTCAVPRPGKGMKLSTRWTDLQDLPSQGSETIVIATEVTPRDSLHEDLSGSVEELHLVGDAMHEGFGVDMQL